MRPDSKVLQALQLATDVVIVNVLLILASLPIVTAGAALNAAHGSLLALIRDDDDGAARGFVRHFRRGWKAASLGWLIMAPLGALLIWEYWVLGAMDGFAALAAQTGVIAGMLLLAMWGVWFFPLVSQGATFRQSARDAALLAVGKLPRTALALLFLALPALTIYLNPASWAIWSAVMVVIGFALALYLADLVLVGTLSRLGAPRS